MTTQNIASAAASTFKVLAAAAVLSALSVPLTVAASTHSAAQGPCAMDARTRTLLGAESGRKIHRASDATDSTTLYTGFIIEIDNQQALEQLRRDGAVIYHHRENLALAYLPRQNAAAIIAGCSHVRSVSASSSAVPRADVSRRLTGVDAVHSGTGISTTLQGLDGTGVVTGLCDIGFDPQHIAFKDRIGQMTVYVDSLALRRSFDRDALVSAGADTPDETHATHVANILAGGRYGNPYYGGAPGSELVVSTSTTLTDVSLLGGIEDIIAYSKARGKPAVVNLSVSSHLGPHDGSDLVNAYLDLLGREAIICISAGNTGHRQYSLHHVFGPDSPGRDGHLYTVGSMMESSLTWSGFDVSGAIDLWGADATPFQVQFVAWDQIEKRFIYQSRWFGGNDASDAEIFDLDSSDGDELDAYMHGTTVAGACATNARNGRYNIYFEYDIRTEAELVPNYWARYIFGWRVRAPQGVDLRAYTEGSRSYMRRYGVPGMVDGTAELSANNMCANSNTICVGSWNGRNRVPDWGGDDRDMGFATDCVTPWSAYETLIDGRALPHFCAVGNTVVSAMSTEYLAAHPQERTAYRRIVDGREYAWYEECGTSMSSPMAAAVIALWCQAYPDLDVHQARDVACQTALRSYADISDPRWGAGSLDARAGLLRVLDIAGVSAPSAETCLVEVRDRCIHVIQPSGHEKPVEVFAADGRRFAPGITLAPGIYIVRVGAGISRHVVF